MLLHVFKEKLQKLNPKLYVDDSAAQRVPGSAWRVASIRLRGGKASSQKTNLVSADADVAKFLSAVESGNFDETVGAVPVGPGGDVPEYEIFAPNEERPRLLARGWRQILQTLAARRFVSLGRARRVFTASLGESDYDRLPLEQRWLLQGHAPRYRRDLFR